MKENDNRNVLNVLHLDGINGKMLIDFDKVTTRQLIATLSKWYNINQGQIRLLKERQSYDKSKAKKVLMDRIPQLDNPIGKHLKVNQTVYTVIMFENEKCTK